MHPRLAWMPSVSIVELLVCQPGASSSCNSQTWNQKGKDHYFLEWNCTSGINHHLIDPTEIIQCPPVTFLVSLWGLKVCSSSGLVWQPYTVAIHDHPLNCWSGGLIRLASTYSEVKNVLHTCKEVHWWQLNGSLPHHELDMASTSPVVSSFSCIGLCA